MAQNKGLTFNPYRTLGTTDVAPEVDLTKFVGKQAKKPTQTVDTYFSTPTGNQKLNVSWKPSQYLNYQSMFQNFDKIPMELKDPLYNINKWDAGYSGLSGAEKKLWDRENAPYIKGADSAYIDRMWRNQQFVKTFGTDAFYQLTPSERDSIYEDKLASDAIKTKFSTNANLNDLLSLTTEGKRELLKSDYKNDYTIEQENQKEGNGDKKWGDYSLGERWNAMTQGTSSRILEGVTLGSAIGSIDPGKGNVIGTLSGIAAGLLVGVGEGLIYPEISEKKNNADRVQSNNAILENIEVSDNERKKKDSQTEIDATSNALMDAYNNGNITEAQINDEFNNIALNGKRTYTDELGRTQIYDYQGSNYYSAFKDSDEFEHFSTYDKVKAIAQAQVFSKKYGQNVAMKALDQDMHNYVTDHQNGLDWACNDLKNLWVGGVAYSMQNVLALGAIDARIRGKDNLADFLNGNTKEGEDKYAGWFNPQYWNKVDQYNTFDVDKIKEADANGGISIYNNAYAPGTENNFWSWATLNEAVKMNKYIWIDLIKNLVLAKGVGLLTKALGGVSIAPGVLASESTAASKIANKVGQFGVLNAGSLGIDFAYGMQTYDDVLQENNAKLNKIINQDATKDTDAYLNTETAQKEFRALVDEENARRKAASPDNWEPVDEKQAWQDYRSTVQNRMVENQEDLHVKDRQEAQKAAADAYVTDATLEHIRMAGTIGMFKNYLFDKGTLNALKLNNPYVDVTVNEGRYALAKNATRKAALRTLGTNVWGGFYSNYMDDVTVGFAKGFGLQEYNNYLFNKYNPAAYGSTIDEYVSPFIAGIAGAGDAMFTKRSFLDGFVGALGTVTSLSVNPLGAASVRDRMKERNEQAKKDGGNAKVSNVEMVADIINSPILQAIADAKSKTRMTEAEINRVNKIISDNSYALDNITETAAALNSKSAARVGTSMIDAEDAKDKEAFTLASQLLQLQNSGIVNSQTEPNKAKWSRKKKIAYALQHTLDAQFGINSQDNTPYTKAMTTLQDASRILEDANSAEEAQKKQDLIDTFLNLDANRSATENMNDQEKIDFATSRIKKNADSLLSMMDRIEALQNKYNTSITANQHPEITNQLIYQYAMDSRWKDRLKEVEEKISGEKSPIESTKKWYKSYSQQTRDAKDSSNSLIAQYGSKEGYERAVEEQNNIVQKVEDAYKKAKEETKIGADPTKSIRENARIKAQKAFTAKAIKKTLEKEKAKLQKIQKDKTALESTDSKTGITSNAFDNVVKAEDILKLPADLRLKILDDFYRKDYTEAQREEIDRAKDLMTQDGTTIGEAMENVKDAAILVNRIDDNMEVAKNIMDNPTIATQMLGSLIENRQRKVVEYFNNKVVAEAFRSLTDPVKGAPVFSTVEDAMPHLQNISTVVLKALKPRLKSLGAYNGVSDKTIDILQDGIDNILDERGQRKQESKDLGTFIRKAEKIPHSEEIVTNTDDGSIITTQATSDRELSQNDKQLLNYALDWAADRDISIDNLASEIQKQSDNFSQYVQERNHGYQTAFNPLSGMNVVTEVGTVENRANEVPVDYMSSLVGDTVKAYKNHKEETAKTATPKETSGKPTSVVSPVRNEAPKRKPENPKDEAVRPDEAPATDDPFGLKKAKEEKPMEAPKEKAPEEKPKEKLSNDDIIQGLDGTNVGLRDKLRTFLKGLDSLSMKADTKSKIKELVNEVLGDNSFSDIDSFIQKLGERCAISGDFDLISSVKELYSLNPNKVTEEGDIEGEVEEAEAPSNDPLGINTLPGITQLSTLDLDVFLDAPEGQFEPQKVYIKEHGIVGFLQRLSDFFKKDYDATHKVQVVFLYDSALAAQVQNSMQKSGANYIADISSPIIMAVEITDANRHLVPEGASLVTVNNNPDRMSNQYMPIGFMPANTNNHKGALSTAVGMSAIRDAVDYTKDGVQIIRLTSSSGKKGNGGAIKTSIKTIMTHTDEANLPRGTENTPKQSVQQLMIDNINSTTESLVPATKEEKADFDNAVQEGKVTTSSLYKKFRKVFIDRLTVQPVSTTSGDSEPKGLFFRIVKGTKDAFNKIVLIKDIASTVSANGKSFIDLLEDIGNSTFLTDSSAKSIIYEFSRCGRLYNKLNEIFKEGNLSAEEYASKVKKAIDNNFNVGGLEIRVIPSSNNPSQFILQALSTEVTDSSNTEGVISELPFTEGERLDQVRFVAFLKDMILDNAGNVRMNMAGFPLVKWQVNYQDAKTLSDAEATVEQKKHARSNLETLFDDGIFEMQITKLAYPVRSVTVHVNNKMREALYTVEEPETTTPIVEKSVGEVQGKEGTIDGDSGTVVTPTRENVLSTIPQKILGTIAQLIENSKAALLTDDGSHYNIAGKLWSRVTSIKYALPGMTSKKRFNKDNAWGLPSTRIGNSFDEFGRDIFNGKFDNMSEEQIKESLKDYPNSTVDNYMQSYHALKAFEQRLLDKGQVIVRTGGTNQITTKGILDVKVKGEDGKTHTKQVRVAGTLDVLAIDKNGNLHIYDFKTSRKELTEQSGKAIEKGYNRQLSMYATFLEQEYGAKVEDINIIPIQCDYPTPIGTDGEGNSIPNAQAEFREQRPGSNQLEVKDTGKDFFDEFRGANFKVGKEFPLKRLNGDALVASYESMSDAEKETIVGAINDQAPDTPTERPLTPNKVEAVEPQAQKKEWEEPVEEKLFEGGDLFEGMDFENTTDEVPEVSDEFVEDTINPTDSFIAEQKDLWKACRNKK